MRLSTLNRFDLEAFLTPAIERKIVRFRKKQVIFSEGDRSDAIFFIQQGIVKLTVTSDQGKEAIIGIFDAGHLFGESCVTPEQGVRFYNAIALTEMRAVRIARGAVIRALRESGERSYPFVTYLLHRSAHIQEDLVNNLLYSSDVRLSRALLSLAESLQRDKTQRFPKLSQQTLAEMIGTTRQRVNALMKQFKESGLITDDWKITPRSRRHLA